MKHLSDYFFESLSKENIKKLEEYISDNNINEYIKLIKRHGAALGVDNNLYDNFFEIHGLSKLNWGRNNSAKKQFIKLFSEEDHLDILTSIINNDGVLSIKDIEENGNIFNLCKIEDNDFSNEAKTIATWTNSTSANAGPCEMLLKFILKEGRTLKTGDVGIYDGEYKEMEVKAATTGKNASGGHAAGQKKNNGAKIRGAWSIYLYLNKNLFNLGDDNALADKSAYFQNDNGIKSFNQLIKDNKLDKDDKSLKILSNSIVDALCFQYNFITNEKDSKNSLNTIDELYDAAYIYCKSIYDNGFKKQDLSNLVGCIQLYLYSQVENFDYFFCVQVDKSDESTNKNNGNYWCVKNCKSPDTKLLKFDIVTNNLYFGQLDSPVSSQGRTGKIYLKIK